MSFKIELTERFKKEFKRLNKTYPSIRNEFDDLVTLLEDNPIQGTSIGNGFYKIRLAIASKGKGKRGGARVITYVAIINETVYLASIYNKSEKENISQKELQDILSGL
ncbi:MAG: type II toxin-antitoxin system RelE/ParE family toxin [Mucilaginibacter sp.]|uniref:type II toxin-antitoxin system RelE/ParE family toxin n=1 Tax=Mucilaginibacter sp. TaxID=1882438 RepID=UPI0034E5F81B